MPAVEAPQLHRARLEALDAPGEGADPFVVLRHHPPCRGPPAARPRPRGLGRVDEAADLYDDVVADPAAQAVAAAMVTAEQVLRDEVQGGPVDLYRGLALAALGDRTAAHERIRSAAGTAASVGWTPWADAAEGFGQETGPGRPPAIPGPTLPLGLRRTP